MAIETIKFSEMTDGGNLANDDKTPGLQGGANVLFNNPWTFLPPGTTADRPLPAADMYFRLRFNTDLQEYEFYDSVLGVWTQLQDSAFTAGPFITYTADPSLPDAQNLGALADGLLKQTIALGVATLDIAVNGTDYFGPGVIVPPNWGGTGVDNGALTITLGSGVTGYVLTSDVSGNATWQPVSTSGSITTIDGDSGSITPTAGVVTIDGGTTGLTTTGVGSTLSLGGLLGIPSGGTGVTSVTISPTATAFAGWDANSNLSANNFIGGFTAIPTAAGITTLTVSSTAIQEFTGVTTQTVVMPVVSTLVAGQQYTLLNNSSGNITVNSSGGNLIQVMAPNTTLYLTCILTSGTTAASWNAGYIFENGAGVLTVVGTVNQIDESASTGNVVLSLSSTLNLPGTFNIQSTTAVDEILDEDDMVSDSPTALATQQSIKTYVDNKFAGVNTSKNLIIGGDFSTNPWQRGTSFTAALSGTAHADRWIWGQSGTGVVTIRKAVDAPTVAQSGIYSQHCIDAEVTTADVAMAGTDYYNHAYVIEGYDFAQIAQRPFILSFWAKSSVTGLYSVAIRNGGGDRTFVGTYTIAVADTWEFFAIPVAASPSAGTWDYTNGYGLILNFIMASGATNQTGTVNSWVVGNFYGGSTSQVNGMATVGNHFKLDLIQLEAGTINTDFEILDEATVLMKCQRYYQKTFIAATAPAQNIGTYVGTLSILSAVLNQSFIINWALKTPMRTIPTVVTYNPQQANADWYDSSAATNRTASIGAGLSDRHVPIVGALGAAGNFNFINATANAEFT